MGELAAAFNQMTGSLEATERRRLQLVGDVAHELRTPLTTLDGYLEGLQDGVVQATPETFALLQRETRRLTRLVNDLQELWRAEAQELPLDINRIQATELLPVVVERFIPEAARRQIDLRITVAEAGPRVLADRDRLDQILGNYLANALRYSSEGSAVTVSAATRGNEVVFSVNDHGPGLTPSSGRWSSSASTASTLHARERWAAPASVWRSLVRWLPPWAGEYGRRAMAPVAGRPSSWRCRQLDQILRLACPL